MSSSNARAAPDPVLTDIAGYVTSFEIASADAYKLARYCLTDALGCAIAALDYPECASLIAPPVPDLHVAGGARVPGTSFELDPVNAAFSLGTMIRWLDANDSFTAADGSHPSDNLGGIVALADYLSRRRVAQRKPPLLMCPHPPAVFYEEGSPVVRLLEDFRSAEMDYFRRTRTFPCIHVIGVRRAVYEKQPSVLGRLFDALEASKLRWQSSRRALSDTTPWTLAEIEDATRLFGRDWYPYGVEKNRSDIEQLSTELHVVERLSASEFDLAQLARGNRARSRAFDARREEASLERECARALRAAGHGAGDGLKRSRLGAC